MRSTHKIQSVLGLFLLLLCMSRVGAAQTTCNSPWNSTSVYTAGMKVSLNGINYTANFWTQGQSPATNNGGSGSGQPWTSNGPCSGSGGGGGGGSCASTWNTTTAYTGGMTASLNGVNYQANFWTQGQNPSTNNGGPGSGAPWTIIGTCSACTTVPSVPTGLQASGTTSNSTNLSWTASTVAVNCVLTGYTVFKNGVASGTTNSPNITMTGLSPLTTYTFRVAANDAARQFRTECSNKHNHAERSAGAATAIRKSVRALCGHGSYCWLATPEYSAAIRNQGLYPRIRGR